MEFTVDLEGGYTLKIKSTPEEIEHIISQLNTTNPIVLNTEGPHLRGNKKIYVSANRIVAIREGD